MKNIVDLYKDVWIDEPGKAAIEELLIAVKAGRDQFSNQRYVPNEIVD